MWQAKSISEGTSYKRRAYNQEKNRQHTRDIIKQEQRERNAISHRKFTLGLFVISSLDKVNAINGKTKLQIGFKIPGSYTELLRTYSEMYFQDGNPSSHCEKGITKRGHSNRKCSAIYMLLAKPFPILVGTISNASNIIMRRKSKNRSYVHIDSEWHMSWGA